MTALPHTLKLPIRLKELFEVCETDCVAGCCGIEAFNFAPIRIAAYLTKYNDRTAEIFLSEIKKNLESLLTQVDTFKPNDRGFICSIEELNQCFTSESFLELILMLQRNTNLAQKVIAYANQISQNDSSE
ncbi:hypothetical protein Pan153_13840 [Gimesia panareensis]|uniref:Uncharacterized protein n=1 Tax=Gimesia panareensis TaxID=2527978 RepID=A0A518FK81_9PLAN|nr:DUF6331 family protein [Gimesia panareensis]QDV16752.1 hypothetical protein Pan153_13840 [Gimesia panareensis]